MAQKGGWNEEDECPKDSAGARDDQFSTELSFTRLSTNSPGRKRCRWPGSCVRRLRRYVAEQVIDVEGEQLVKTKEIIDRIFKEPGIRFELTEFENLGKPIHDILSIYPKVATTGKDAGKTRYFVKSFIPFSTGNEEVQVYAEGENRRQRKSSGNSGSTNSSTSMSTNR